MRTVRALAVIPAVALLLAACGSDDKTSGTDAPTTAASSAPDSTDAATTVSAAPTESTVEESTTPETAIDGPIQIDVVVGVDSGPNRIVQVKVGSDVTLNITNPNAADEFHIHGVDLEQEVDAGVMATFNFVADTAGTFEVESHDTEDVLLILEVS